MGVNSFETALLNLVPSGIILYVVIATEGGSKSKNDLHWDESSWKGLSNESRDLLFSCSRCRDIQGLKLEKLWPKLLKKSHVGRRKGLKRVWIGSFHPKVCTLKFVFEFYILMYCYMNVHNTPMGVLWWYYWEYQRIFAMFLSIFCVTTKKIFFPDTLYIS